MRKNTFAVVIASALLGPLAAQADPSSTAVGTKDSNVDKDSSSGEYYPYSAGTVGDDPAEPTSTAVSPDADDEALGPTDQWGQSDTDGDDKLTRGEFRTWRESREASR